MNETTWQYTVQDFSPLFTYAGSNTSPEVNLDAAWSQNCPSGGSGPLSGNTLCDVESAHTTANPGASVTLAFNGQSIQLLGNVAGGMQYDVNIDGNITAGAPSSTLLASISGLSPGNHTVSLTTKSSGSGSILAFQGAVVTVGTGSTGANVTRTDIQDNDIVVQYTASSSNAWQVQQYDGWDIQHSTLNTTWHQLNANTSGSYTIPFQGNAILVHGFAWAYFPSSYRVSIDGEPPVTHYANASLAYTGNPGFITIDALLYFRANLSNDPHVLVVDNDQGIGFMGLDYVEVIDISAGSPLPQVSATAKQHSQKPIGAIVGLSIGLPLLILVIVAVFLYFRRTRRPDAEVQSVAPAITPFEFITTPPVSTIEKGSNALTFTPFSSFPPLTVTTSNNPSQTNISSTTGKRRYLDTNDQSTATTTSPSTASGPDSPTQQRIRELQAELARAREHGSSNSAELQGLRQDLQHLMQIVERPRLVNDNLPPPEYASAVRAAATGSSIDISPRP